MSFQFKNKNQQKIEFLELEQFKASKILSLYPQSRLYKAVRIDTGDEVTIKKVVIPNQKIRSKNYLIKQVEVLKRMQSHQNVSTLLNLIEGENAVYLVYQELDSSLQQYLEVVRGRGKSLSQSEIMRLINQICSGIAHLQNNGIIHGDICAKNIYLNKKKIVQIMNMEMAYSLLHKVNDPINRQNLICTPFYNSPEAILQFPKPYNQSDAFATGCMIPELFNLKPLFQADSDINQLYKYNIILGTPSIVEWSEGHQRANSKRLILPQSSGINLDTLIPEASSLVLDIIRKLTRINALTRATCAEILPYFMKMQSKIDALSLPKTVKVIDNQQLKQLVGGGGLSPLKRMPIYQQFNLLNSSTVNVRRLPSQRPIGILKQKTKNDLMFFSQFNNLNEIPIERSRGSTINLQNSQGNILIRDSDYFQRKRSAFLSTSNSPMATIAAAKTNRISQPFLSNFSGSSTNRAADVERARNQIFQIPAFSIGKKQFEQRTSPLPHNRGLVSNITFNQRNQLCYSPSIINIGDQETIDVIEKNKYGHPSVKHALNQSESINILNRLKELRNFGGNNSQQIKKYDQISMSLDLDDRRHRAASKTLDIENQTQINQQIDEQNRQIFQTLDITSPAKRSQIQSNSISLPNSPNSERKQSQAQKQFLPQIQPQALLLPPAISPRKLDTDQTQWEYNMNSPNYYQNKQFTQQQLHKVNNSPSKKAIMIQNDQIMLPQISQSQARKLSPYEQQLKINRRKYNFDL